MGPSPAKQGSEIKSPSPTENVYYGVYMAPDIQPSAEDVNGPIVFTDKSEALKLVKKYKKARFKMFKTEEDAFYFALYGPETPVSNITVLSPPSGPDEKPSPFRGPKPQDMVRFRKAIEAGDLDFVKRTIWENPRYLVSSGDTPAILQEGSRYNALHVAAKAGNASICAFVLLTIGNVGFMGHLYGDAASGDAEQRCDVLLDLYLNMPDKAMNETPLHFAAKFGAASVVQVLVTYPKCDKNAKNKFNQTAKDMICSRRHDADSALKEAISAMLEEQFYVPVLRSPDMSVQPIVGKPFSPSSPLPENHDHGDIINPQLEVQALAGPMPRQAAEIFRRRWKTPPRSPFKPGPGMLPRSPRPSLTDQDKGWEKVGRELAQECKVPWKEYWTFLDSYIDLSSVEGLQRLEDFLRKRFKSASEEAENSDSSSSSSRALPDTPPLQANGSPPRLSQSQESSPSPVTKLCRAMQTCRLSGIQAAPRHTPPRHHTHPHQHLHSNGDVGSAPSPPTTLITSPLLCLEKSCQVFAKRIVSGCQVSETDGDLKFLTLEMKHLNDLVASYKEDRLFDQVDFQKFHSRLAHLVTQQLDLTEMPKVLAALQSLANRKEEETYSSDEEESAVELRFLHPPWSLRHAAVCVARSMLSCVLETVNTTLPDTEQACVDAWKMAEPCNCTFLSSRRLRARPQPSKRLSFSDDGVSDETFKRTSLEDDTSGEESDTSDTSESEWFTPPSSPGVRSDEDQAMESPDEGPEVYISGTKPSKLDMSVMEAIEGSEISRAKYPNIYRWQHLVLLHSQSERLSWLSTPKHNKVHSTWHRTPSLHFSTD